MQKKLFLLDAYALIYRAYYAFIKNPVRNSKGLNTSAILGFTNTLVEVLEKEKPSHIAVAFDPAGPTFRNEIYEQYKAHREKMPEDIQLSIPYIQDIIRAFNIPMIEVEGYEADDVIGTLAYQAKDKDFETYMMTPDKDYGQLLTEKIYMYKPKRSGGEAELINEQKICEQFGIDNPRQIIDIMALWGDKSDNIPGAPGIGEKTAKKLIAYYGSVEKLYENINDLTGKQKENLINYKDQVMISKELVQIKLNVPTKINTSDIELRQPDEEKLTRLFQDLEFKTLAKRIFNKDVSQRSPQEPLQQTMFGESAQSSPQPPETGKETISSTDKDYQLTDTKEKRKKLIQTLKKLDEFCFDTETTSVNPHEAELVGIAISWQKDQAFFIPFPQDQKEAQQIAGEFRKVFEDAKIRKVGQNIKYDILVMRNYGIRVQGRLFDTMIAHYLLQPEQRHNLTILSEKYLNYTPISIEELIGKKGKNQRSMRSVPIQQITPYACEDADLTWQLREILEKELKEHSLWKLAAEMEMPLIHVLIRMEVNGVTINEQELKQYAGELREELGSIEKEVHDMAGVDFNIDSPKQLGEVLFDRMKIVENPRKTRTKQYSTSEETLQQLSDKHPIIRKVLDYRSVRKLLSTYVEALPELIHPQTGKIHTSFNQAIAATGRLSSYNPNLQNIPIREERGRKIRKAFVPSDKDHILLAADYSQIELRIMAHMSGDPKLIDAFHNNLDIHSSTAARLFHLDSLEDVTQEQRRKAKTANFGIIYGISAYGLSQRLNIPRKEAKEIIDSYFNNFSRVKEYMDQRIEAAREKGYVETIWGRKRFLENINSRNATLRGMAERNAINAPIQGSAADIIKVAMLNIDQELLRKKYQSKLILQVHDELIFDVYRPELKKLTRMVTDKMEHAHQLDVPLTVETGTGENWLEAH
ncbi:MAG: DNA polymerase I [Bacteroidales bacterium]|nr:DNA polymerase I [Bacteroidales bacterium]